MSKLKKDHIGTSVWCQINGKTIKVCEENTSILIANGHYNLFEGFLSDNNDNSEQDTQDANNRLLKAYENDFEGDYYYKKEDLLIEMNLAGISGKKSDSKSDLMNLIKEHYDNQTPERRD